jgi:hypothetical protein
MWATFTGERYSERQVSGIPIVPVWGRQLKQARKILEVLDPRRASRRPIPPR